MKMKLILSLIFLAFLASCHTFKETASQYERLPIKAVKSPSKEGRACGEYTLPISLFYSNVDITVESARQNGNITEISSIESEFSHSFGYKRICTVVRGN